MDQEIAPGDSIDVTGVLPDFPLRGEITVYAVVDPKQEVDDCARSNNTASSDNPHTCRVLVI